MLWAQNMRNRTIPDWHMVEKSLLNTLRSSFRDLPTLRERPGTQCYPLVDDMLAVGRTNVFSSHLSPDPRVSCSILKAQARDLKGTWRGSVFDKAAHKAWLTCTMFALQLWVKCFLSDPHKCETMRARTHGPNNKGDRKG